MIQKAKNVYESLRTLTGSIMSDENIIHSYNSLSKTRKKSCFYKINNIVKLLESNEKEKAFALFVVEINIVSFEEKVDPAVLLYSYTFNLNTNKENKKSRWRIIR